MYSIENIAYYHYVTSLAFSIDEKSATIQGEFNDKNSIVFEIDSKKKTTFFNSDGQGTDLVNE